jgi:hypothetical protein
MSAIWGTLIGTAGILAGYLGAAGTVDLRAQLAWTALAVGATIVSGAGNAMWLASRYKLVRARIGKLSVPAVPVRPAQIDGRLVASRAMTRYHRPDCLMVRGKTVRAASPSVHHRAGRNPCGVCEPC